MGMTSWLARAAVRRVHVLVVEVPGQWRLRAAAQRELGARGWPEALSPADADLLLVCGVPGDDLLPLVRTVWAQLPGPRAQASVLREQDIAAALDQAAAGLLDGDAEPQRDELDQGMAPGEIPLAQGAEDRDGLEMDVLHLRLGPVLPAWSAGLVLTCTLAGDVVTEAEATVLGLGQGGATGAGDRPPNEQQPAPAAQACDHVGMVLALAGWRAGAWRAHAIRDRLLSGATPAEVRPQLQQLRRRVARSVVLRWSLGRTGAVTSEQLTAQRLPDWMLGSVHDRVLAMLDASLSALESPAEAGARPWPTVPVPALPALVTGLELAAVRLQVASLGLDPVAAVPGVRHG